MCTWKKLILAHPSTELPGVFVRPAPHTLTTDISAGQINEKIIKLLLCELLTPSLGVIKENESASSASKQSSTGEALLQEELLTVTLTSVLYLYLLKHPKNMVFYTPASTPILFSKSTALTTTQILSLKLAGQAHQTTHLSHFICIFGMRCSCLISERMLIQGTNRSDIPEAELHVC